MQGLEVREQGCDEAKVSGSTSFQQPLSEGFQPSLWCQGLHKRLPVLITHLLEEKLRHRQGFHATTMGPSPPTSASLTRQEVWVSSV